MVFHVFRDLSSVRAEVTKSVRVVQGACMDLDKNLRGMDANTQSALEDERARRQKVTLQKLLIFPFFLLARLITSDLQWYFLVIHNSLFSYDTPCLPPNFVQPLFFFLFLLGNSVFRRPQINLGILISYIVSSLTD